MVTSTGKTVELKTITRREGIKYKLASLSGYDGYQVFYDAALAGTGLTASEFEKKYTDEEIIEIAGAVFNSLKPSEEQKKVSLSDMGRG